MSVAAVDGPRILHGRAGITAPAHIAARCAWNRPVS